MIAPEGWQSGRMRRSWNLAAILLNLQLRPQQIPALVTALREGPGGHGAEGFTLDGAKALDIHIQSPAVSQVEPRNEDLRTGGPYSSSK